MKIIEEVDEIINRGVKINTNSSYLPVDNIVYKYKYVYAGLGSIDSYFESLLPGVDISSYLLGDIKNLSNIPLPGEDKAVDRILKALKNGEKIGVYGDYDADGISGCALGINVLKSFGGNVTHFINNRFSEGFGICPQGVKYLYTKGVNLIITVDNGITGFAGVNNAISLGIDVIVTDHHEADDTLPNCLCVNPKLVNSNYDNKDLPGVGVLFKVLLNLGKKLNRENFVLKQLDLVAIGTIGDMSKMTIENRVIVKNGLKLFNWEKRKHFVKILKEKLNIRRDINAEDIGYIIAPMLNAESRMLGKPNYALKLLTSSDYGDIEEACENLIEINIKRKEEVIKELAISLDSVDLTKDIIIVYNPLIQEGLAGIIAGRLLEKFNRPAIVLGQTKEGLLKGSGRSNINFNLKGALDKFKKFIINYGGHKEACGLTIKEDNYQLLKNFLETYASEKLKGSKLVKSLDFKIEIDDISLEIAERINFFEPFGIGFKKPSFLIENTEAKGIILLKGIHTKFNVNGLVFLFFNNVLEEGYYSFHGSLIINTWRDKKKLQFMIDDYLEGNIKIESKKD